MIQTCLGEHDVKCSHRSPRRQMFTGKLPGNPKRCGCRCTPWPSTPPTLWSRGQIPFFSSLGLSLRFWFSVTVTFEIKPLSSWATNQCAYLMGLEVTKEDSGGLLWAFKGCGREYLREAVCASFPWLLRGTEDRERMTMKTTELLPSLLSGFNIWGRGWQQSVEGAVRVWPPRDEGLGCISGMSLGLGNPSYLHVCGNEDGWQTGEKTLAGDSIIHREQTVKL